MYYRARIGETGDTGIRTPDYVLAEIRTTHAAVLSLARDLAAAPTVPDRLRRGFDEFSKEWSTFVDDYSRGVGAWFGRGTTPVWDKVMEYRDRLAKWQAAARQAGVGITAIDTPTRSPGKSWSIWPFVIGGAVVLGVSYLLYRPRGQARELSHE